MIFVLLLPAFFLMHNYNELFGFIPGRQVLADAIIIYFLLLVSYLIIAKISGSNIKSALIVFALSSFILLFGPIHSLFQIISFKSILGTYKIFLPLCCILLIILVRKIIRSNSIPSRTILYLNVVMICLVSTEIIVMIGRKIEFDKTNNLIYPQKPLCGKYVSKKIPDSIKPDIYFLVFDEYTNSKTLKKIWNFNNDSITDWLAAHDFYVVPNSRANYSFTPYSISSTFNMDYIYDVKKSMNATIPLNILQGIQSSSDNETFCILHKENYNIRFLAPFRNSIEDNNLEHYFDDLIDDQIYRQTLPGSIEADILWHFTSGKWAMINDTARFKKNLQKRFESIQRTVREVKATANTNERKPQFVYGHFLITHGPHIFDSTGAFNPDKIIPDYPMFYTYPEQIICANKVMEDIISYIRLHNKPNTIIIVEGDHGFRQIHGSGADMYLPNFSAVYFPDKNYSQLYGSISPLNMFRMIFNHYFYQNFPLLKDSGIVVKENKS